MLVMVNFAGRCFRLTYLPAYAKGPTHEWRQIGRSRRRKASPKKSV